MSWSDASYTLLRFRNNRDTCHVDAVIVVCLRSACHLLEGGTVCCSVC